ncbi:hypothetical protein BV898_14622 [Hypsibius exemplaris]|uniref:DOMON domain-containing protein n=1 Tax=Hypsibius exemplaris TaxID=2072580 RepID=A0A9X6NG76_HYPEX|nr:hypothetical protein BV898_14622 [Hypsibius exemplaris]
MSSSLVLFLGLLLAHSAVSIDLQQKLKLTKNADGGSLDVAWGANDTHVEVELTYPTTGWLALGLSPDGGMDMSDVLFGYVNGDGTFVVQDRYLAAPDGVGSLSLDTTQNWQGISGSKNGTFTQLRAVRAIRTGDSAQDRAFTDKSQNVIVAMSPTVPDSPTAPIRKHSFKFSTSLTFLSAATPAPVTVVVPSVVVPQTPPPVVVVPQTPPPVVVVPSPQTPAPVAPTLIIRNSGTKIQTGTGLLIIAVTFLGMRL